MKKLALAAVLALLPLTVFASPAPEKAAMSVSALEKTATHVIDGEVQRVYKTEEREGNFRYQRYVAEVLVQAVMKAPAVGGPGADESEGAAPTTMDTSLVGELVYVRWFSRSWIGRDAPATGSGHYGWAPKKGERARAYLARNAYDGWNSAEENSDGGYNVIPPNGFSKLPALPKAK